MYLKTVFLSAVLLFVSVEAVRLSTCRNTNSVKYIEGYDDPTIYCYGSGDNTSIITWTLRDNTGTTKRLATCNSVNNCNNPYASSGLNVYRSYWEQSRIFLPNIAREFSGTLTCTETSTSSVKSASCTVYVKRLRLNCGDGLQVREGNSITVRCYHSTYTPRTLNWTLTTNSGKILHLGSCDPYRCTSLQGSNTSFARISYYDSLVFSPVFSQRRIGGQLSCSSTYNGTTDVDTCPLEIYNDGQLSNCRTEVSRHNWSFTASCDASKFWSSRGRFEFRVQEFFNRRKHVVFQSNAYTFEDRRALSLYSYTDPADKKTYYRGNLTYSWPIIPIPGTYTSFRVYTYPGGRYNTWNHLMNITLPEKPHHNCSDGRYVRQSVTKPCVCTADYMGSPAGRLVWLVGGITLAVGEYGAKELKFPHGQSTHLYSELYAQCQLDWITPLTTLPFVLNVTVQQQAQTAIEMTWVAVSGWTLLAVVIVVSVVVFIVTRRRRKGGICCCKESRYDNTRRQTDDDPKTYTDLNVLQNGRNAVRPGNQIDDVEDAYENMAMEKEGHM